MTLRKLYLKNFLSFKEETIDLDQYKSPILVKGVVGDSEASNGAGKSSLFEALYWALTGKPVRSVKAADVIRHGASDVRVVVEFDFNSHTYRVDRVWSSSIKRVIVRDVMDNTEQSFHTSSEATKHIFGMFGISAEVFSLIVFFGKKFKVFSNLSGRERSDVIEILSQSGVYERARIAAADDAKNITFDIDNSKRSVDSLTADRDSAKAVIDRLKVEIEHKRSINATQILKLKSDIGILSEGVKVNEAELDRLNYKDLSDDIGNINKAVIEELNKKLALSRDKFSVAEGELNKDKIKFTADLDKLSDSINDANVKVSKASEELRAHDYALNTGECFWCKQPLKSYDESKHEFAKSRHEKLSKELKVLVGNKDGILNELEVIKGKISAIDFDRRNEERVIREEIEAKRVKMSADLVDRLNACKKLMSDVENSKKEIVVKKGVLARLEDDSDIAKKEGALENEKIGLENIIAKLGSINESIFKLNKKLEAASYWKVAFKDIRFASFNNTVKALQKLISVYCKNQGLLFDSIEVTQWRETARGKTVPDIDIVIKRGKNKMSLAAMSEGEAQKINLACYLSMVTLIKNCSGFEFDTMVLDEPLGGLDYEGRQAVFDMMLSYADKKRVIVIDHNAEFQSLFGDVITISKKGGISHVL